MYMCVRVCVLTMYYMFSMDFGTQGKPVSNCSENSGSQDGDRT